jgi:uncharacterized UBP type Zn finger protein
MSDDTCTHVPEDLSVPEIRLKGCEDCLAAGKHNWVHLRFCQTCGHVGCCDNSPGKHATAHYRTVEHPLIRSYEPEEDWFYCYVDDDAFFIDEAPPAPSYTD